jgi:hypothetical protein
MCWNQSSKECVVVEACGRRSVQEKDERTVEEKGLKRESGPMLVDNGSWSR